jgi:hypothetical protein
VSTAVFLAASSTLEVNLLDVPPAKSIGIKKLTHSQPAAGINVNYNINNIPNAETMSALQSRLTSGGKNAALLIAYNIKAKAAATEITTSVIDNTVPPSSISNTKSLPIGVL